MPAAAPVSESPNVVVREIVNRHMAGLDCPDRAPRLGGNSGAMLDPQMARARLREGRARKGPDASPDYSLGGRFRVGERSLTC